MDLRAEIRQRESGQAGLAGRGDDPPQIGGAQPVVGQQPVRQKAGQHLFAEFLGGDHLRGDIACRPAEILLQHRRAFRPTPEEQPIERLDIRGMAYPARRTVEPYSVRQRFHPPPNRSARRDPGRIGQRLGRRRSDDLTFRALWAFPLHPRSDRHLTCGRLAGAPLGGTIKASVFGRCQSAPSRAG
jgi:hypothetical protein